MIHSVHSCFHTIYLAFSHSNNLTTQNFSLSSFGTNQTNRFFFSSKFNQKPIKRTCWWREPIFKLYLKQQKNDTKAFLVCYRLFFFFFFFQCFPFCVLFFFFFFFAVSRLFFFFFQLDLNLYFFFFLTSRLLTKKTRERKKN